MSAARQPWRIDGPSTAPERPGLPDALRRLHLAERRPPTEADAPPLSVLPMTRTALLLTYGCVPRGRLFP